MCIGRLTQIATLILFSLCSQVASGQTDNDSSGVELQNVGKSDLKKIKVIVPATDGVLQWSDVATSVADELKLDRDTVAKLLPRGQIDLNSNLVLLTLMGVNAAARDAISFDLVRDSESGLALSVECDASIFGTEKVSSRAKALGIDFDKDWVSRAMTRPLMICFHGLQSDPVVFDAMRAHLRSQGWGTAAVSYDSQRSIAETAQRLSAVMDQQWEAVKTRPRLALVGHSMGGLVARECAENEALGQTSVVSLITIGTPHGGSAWATLPPVLDLATEGEFDPDDLMDLILHRPNSEGLRDLAPGSEFLRRLDSRPRRPEIAYTTICGTGSPIKAEQVDQLRRILQQLERRRGLVRLIRPRIQPLLEGFDELARGKGDGAVAADRAVIEGVKDVVQVDLSHFDLVQPILGRTDHPVWKVVDERLNRVSK